MTVAPSLTETVIALGATNTLVGVSRFDERAEVAKLERVGGFNDPSVETVLALKPQLVLLQKAPGNQKPVQKLAELGIPILALPLTGVDDVLDSIRTIGHLLGHDADAKTLTTRLETTRASIRSRAAKLPHPRVLFVYGFNPLVVAGPGSYAHELVTDAGGIDVVEAGPSAYPTYSAERAVALKPDVVIDSANVMDGQATFKNLAGLKDARWVSTNSQALLHPGPALADGLEELFAMLHPAKDAGK
ncbi:MAG: helical backbone metal receptor [Myxococcaceae bacterium]